MTQSTLLNFFSLVKTTNPSLSQYTKDQNSLKDNEISSPRFLERQNSGKNLKDFFNRKSVISSKTPDKRALNMDLEINTNKQTHKEYSCSSEFLQKWLKKENLSNNSKNRLFLPKDLMLKVMQFLDFKDNARLARVCKFWNKCFNSIWLCYDFFGKFNLNAFSSERQINKVFEKSSKLCHIRKMKSILVGKKVDAFIKRTKLTTTLAKNNQMKGNMFEEFSIEPRNKGLVLFLSDKEVCDLCESSKFSLSFVSLISCHLLSEKSFISVSKCNSLQVLNLCNNSFFKDDDLLRILMNCKNLTTLNVTGCVNLTDASIENISIFGRKIEILEIADIPNMLFMNFCRIRNLKNLIKLNVSNSKIDNLALNSYIKDEENVENLEYLNISSCENLNRATIILFCCRKIPKLRYMNIKGNKLINEEDVWKLVYCYDSLIELIADPDLITRKVLDKLDLNKIIFNQRTKK